MEAHVRPAEHPQKVSAKRDYLNFHLELAVELIGTFSSRKCPGCPRSDEHARHTRLNRGPDHFPRSVAKAKHCVVCEGVRRRKSFLNVATDMSQEPIVPPVKSTYVQMMSIGVLRSTTSSFITVTNCIFFAI